MNVLDIPTFTAVLGAVLALKATGEAPYRVAVCSADRDALLAEHERSGGRVIGGTPKTPTVCGVPLFHAFRASRSHVWGAKDMRLIPHGL